MLHDCVVTSVVVNDMYSTVLASSLDVPSSSSLSFLSGCLRCGDGRRGTRRGGVLDGVQKSSPIS